MAPAPVDSATVAVPAQTQDGGSTAPPATATTASLAPADIPIAPLSPTVAVAEGTPTPSVVVVPPGTPSPTSEVVAPVDPTVSTTPSPLPTVGPTTHTYYLSSSRTAKDYYCDTDSQWKTLSSKNVKQFPSAEAALAAYPGRKLHRPC